MEREIRGSGSEAALKAQENALEALLGTTSTTLAAAIAVCRYIAEVQPPDDENMGCGFIFWDGEENEAVRFIGRLADCMAKHA
jgi:hypothetical protein